MKTYKFIYRTESNHEDYLSISAPNKIAAWDLFQTITNDFNEKVVCADVVEVII